MELSFELNVRIYTDGETTVAVLESPCGCDTLGVGFAKLHPSDNYNQGTGIDLATLRAIDQWRKVIMDDLAQDGITVS